MLFTGFGKADEAVMHSCIQGFSLKPYLLSDIGQQEQGLMFKAVIEGFFLHEDR